MPSKPSLVINTSPLVALAAALDDFQVIGEVATLIVPGEVQAELTAGANRDDVARWIIAAPFCAVRRSFPSLPPALLGSLEIGEAAVIHTAITESVSTVAIDERKGRRWATLHGLRVTGSLGLLLALQRRGLMTSMDGAIERMKARGIYLSDLVVSEALRLQKSKP
jgi:hypothetical protein